MRRISVICIRTQRDGCYFVTVAVDVDLGIAFSAETHEFMEVGVKALLAEKTVEQGDK